MVIDKLFMNIIEWNIIVNLYEIRVPMKWNTFKLIFLRRTVCLYHPHISRYLGIVNTRLRINNTYKLS